MNPARQSRKCFCFRAMFADKAHNFALDLLVAFQMMPIFATLRFPRAAGKRVHMIEDDNKSCLLSDLMIAYEQRLVSFAAKHTGSSTKSFTKPYRENDVATSPTGKSGGNRSWLGPLSKG